MSLPPGTRLGSYQVIGQIGSGGMGEVYRAIDNHLGRHVAIKVLPEAFGNDPERLARFDREARTLAALNHPNIAIVYGFEAIEFSIGSDQSVMRALVMELVDGETLGERIARGSVPVDEALSIGKQIAQALEAAHEQGIIHRDLKPANIKVRPDGAVKVLDFGLAKALSPSVATSASLSMSPTITTPAMTQAGLILGTAAYMSPEQARGKPVDQQTDIWAFGCVLYEMLAGRRVFEGHETTDVIAAIVTAEVDWARLPPTPAAVQRLLRRALAKDRKQRLPHIAVARLEIDEALGTLGETALSPTSMQPISRVRRFAPVIVATLVTAIAVGVASWTLERDVPGGPSVVTRSLVAIEPFDRRTPALQTESRPRVARPNRTIIALSPDGRTLVFRALGDKALQLFRRRLDLLETTPIPGTEGATSPFFSPDGAWIGFWVGGEIRRVSITGGPASVITKVPGAPGSPMGISWGAGDRIVFATEEGLWRVPASGGRPEAVSKPDPGEYAHRLPQFLPGGDSILFTVAKASFRWDDAQVVVQSLRTGQRTVLLIDGADARYLPSGHLVFVRRGTLMAATFDHSRLALTGPPVALIEGVMQAVNFDNSNADSGAAQFVVADNGSLIYATGGITTDNERAMVWVDRDGTVEHLPAERREYLAPRLSPDGQRVAVFTQASRGTVGNRVWIYDLLRHTLEPLTSVEERGTWSVWSPDGSRVAFRATDTGNLFSRLADGTGPSETAHDQ